jgi:hypothetical protein
MAVIIGDIHGNLAKAKAFLSYKPEEEHVALGDYVDSFTVPALQQIVCLKLLLESNCVLLWGNHDLHYLPQRPWVCSGYQQDNADIFRDMYVNASENKRLQAAYAVCGWLCTHAGVSPEIAELIPPGNRTPTAAASWLNAEFERTRQEPQAGQLKIYGNGPLYYIARIRGGRDPYGGIFWFDTFHEGVAPSPLVGKQLFSHTERSEPEGVPGEWWDLDTTNSLFCWIFDTNEGCPKHIPYL